ncbi:MAG: methyltransferase RsmF C-terminal domain-like protein, partial [Chitinophagaceae bacterium]
GSGLFRKQPEAIDEWSSEAVKLCSLRQQRILTDLLPALKDGGLLLYATCSYSMEENEEIIDWLIDTELVEPIKISVPENWQITTNYTPKNGAACFRFFPHKTQGEGFFVTALRKKTAAFQFATKEQILAKPDKKQLANLKPYLPSNKNLTIFQQSGITRVIDTIFEKELSQIAACLYIKKAGNALGSFKGNDFIPHHEWAMSQLSKDSFPTVELYLTEALQYLKRNDFMPEATNNKGWHLATYCGLPLGWMKVLPNRMNNYYPNEWRILKG